MKFEQITILVALTATVTVTATPAFATNGMCIEGYGPIASSMGGASMAYDNGTASMINNPATLGFMETGASRLDVALGDLMPDASSNGAHSSAEDYYIPAMGYVRKDVNLSWGVGVMVQGGMGTEFSNGSFWGEMTPFGGTPNAFNAVNNAAQANLENMSEISIGRVMFPFAYQVNDALTLGGGVDYVWAGMDIKWLIDGKHFQDMIGAAVGGRQIFGRGSGSLVNTMLATPGLAGIGYGYFDFEDNGKFSQAASGAGWAGNLGFTYKVSPELTVGSVYHAKTHISDLTTSDGAATATFAAQVGPVVFEQPVTGKVTIQNFQWPETYGLGFSYQASPKWMVVADYKRINWSDVMKDLNMSFESNGDPGNGGFGGGKTLNIEYFQNWKDQNVFQIGAAYKYNDALTVRFGTNIANNPIPDQYVSPLFPAVITVHYTAGFGYAFSKVSSFDASFAYAPEVTVTNNWSAAGGSNQDLSMSGTSWQMLYSYRF